ncbi:MULTISPECIES: 2-amino-4-hydroxy-6-hydroxymethyldihydropteridine diphosphokinase [Gammaproteobacteria]|uniref:2-amino-4-hydroxy-6- hydroxymethyldihydropteridine diphosphokinase n=1 Tax=Gammaproteobacteria TaxID=1236 RepID=UPI000DCF685B|nr:MULTISPECIES: 2-amino-4-hydroxy-6-hydroxymethyldihydropteridine diphosphokinase [Gammaproteobacteria]RTE87705.1 2-amino-4-hydroxy-6-hydroxymethyldihydropteridine diphosphokinase [Aliidiomarina sp. B3213]TCZ92512.1 2-amino-4-hydroxy-6-hydroxymethyldihydropteridine diphosphokinase [Lysobacter sp. N42]
MIPVFLGLGSNINREHNIKAAIQLLEKEFSELRASKVYENEAIGFEGPPFFNLVVAVETDKPLLDVQKLCKDIEVQLGREEKAPRFSSKTLDIDILLYGKEITAAKPGIPKLPRTEITEQAYVLKPLSELAPYLQHPETQVTFLDIWKAYNAKEQPNTILREFSLQELIEVGKVAG